MEDLLTIIRILFELKEKKKNLKEMLKKIESEIDELYRTLELQLLNGDLEPSVVLSTLEVIRRIERASDEALNALDLVTILVMI